MTILENPLNNAHHLYLNGEEVKDLVIPDGVTSIGNCAFSGCSGLTSVTIPNSVTSIGGNAFRDCRGLTSTTIGNGVASIGGMAFAGCGELKSVVSEIENPFAFGASAFSEISSTCTLTVPYGTKDAYIAKGWTTDVFKGGIVEAQAPSPNIAFADDKVKALCVANWDTNNDGELSEAEAAAVTDIGSAFTGNTEITSFDELDYFTSLTIIGPYTFKGCSNLTSVTIPTNVASIEKSAFEGCIGMKSVSIGYGVTYIGEEAFKNCSSLTTVTIPNSVTEIGWAAFWGCVGLTSVSISNSIVSLDGTFVLCSSLASVTIPNSVTSIGFQAFSGCSSLASVTIPSSVTSLGQYAFKDCSSLTSITFSNSITSIGSYAFSYTPWYQNLPNGLIYVSSVAYQYKGTMPEKTNIVIKNGTTSISPNAFYRCSNLTSVTIPASVTEIGSSAFLECSNLTSVISEIQEPFVLVSSAFRYISSTCSLTVPYGTKEAYIAAGWTEDVFKGGIVEAPDLRASQSIALASLPSMTYGDATYTLPSKTNEGLNLTWNSSATSVVTISGNTLTVKGAGSATITATQAGNDNYKPFSKEFTLRVAKAPLTITAQSYTIKQGEAMPTFAATYTGFKNNETPAALTIRPTITCSTTSSSTPGTYDITPSGASSANYKISYVKGTLTVLYDAAVDNTLAIENAEVSKGGRVVLPVNMNNVKSITALQFEVSLPAGATLSKCQLTDRKGDDHKASYRKLSNGNYQVTVFSMSKAVFSGTEGAVANLTLDVDKGATAGAYPINITNIELTTAATQAINPADVTAILTINNVKPGDTNGDGKVSITDAVAIVGYILGENIDGFVVAAADANGDGNVNIFDVTKVINIILGEDDAESKMRGMMAMNEIGTMQTVANGKGTSLMVDNAERYIAMQFDVVVAAGQSVEDVTLNSTADHLLFYQQTEKNRYRVLACSMLNENFEPTEEALVDLKQAKGAKIENAMFVTTDGRCVNMTVTEEATGIETAEVEKSSDAIYNLSGQYMGTDVNALPNGTYIRNQKKFVIK